MATMKVCTSCGADLPETARFCAACAAPVEVEQGQREWKLATMVFADLVGSTQLAERQDPERTRLLLEPGGHVDGIACDEGAALSGRTHDDLTGIHADAQGERSGEKLVHPSVHRKCDVQGSLGVVLE